MDYNENILEKEKQFRQLFEQSMDGIIVHKKGEIINVNNMACNILGYTRDELCKMQITDFYDPSEHDRVRKNIERKERSLRFESQWKRSDGKKIHVEIRSVIMDFDSFLTQSIFRDVTERKMAEKSLKESEERYRILVENIDMGISLIDPDFNIVMVNSAQERLFKRAPNELIGKKCFREFEKKDSICLHCPGVGAMANAHSAEVETEGVRQDGSRFNAMIHAFPIIGEDNTAKGFIEVVEDITESKKTSDALQESEARYKSIFHDNPYVIYVRDPETQRITDVNPAACKFYGYGREEMIGMHVSNITLAPLEKVEKDDTEQMFNKSRDHFIARHRIADGDERDVEIYNGPMTIYGRSAFFCIVRDITDRMQAEKALRESEARHKIMFENNPSIILIRDPETQCYTDVNPAACKFYGYGREEMIGMHISNITERKIEGIEKTDRESTLVKGQNHVIAHHKLANGDTRDVEIHYCPMTIDGKMVFFNIVNDITERVRSEKELQESEKRFRRLVDHASDTILLYDFEDNRIIDVNRSGCKDLGYTREELLNMKIPGIVQDFDYEERMKARKELVPGRPVTFEGVNKRKDGTTFPVEIRQGVIETNGGKLLLALIRDITDKKRAEEEKKRLEAQLIHAQKIESIATLAGGIAHNFNNLLMGILGNSSLVLLDTDPSDPHYERLKNIEKLIQSGSKLTNQLMTFARGGTSEVKPINLNTVIREVTNTFTATNRGIVIHRELDDGIPRIIADQGQIEQVLFNLLVNAKQALFDQGDIFIKTWFVTGENFDRNTYNPKPGGYVLLSIRDTGIGMDEEIKDRIFEPFFTTKGLASGTGLGLASVYGVVKSHEGYIDIESEKGQGTTFRIYLPATEKEAEEGTKPAGEVIKGGNETVLLVDDEALILEVGKGMLENIGYEAITASCGEEALDLYSKNQDRIGIVLLDIIMPKMGGKETFKRLKEINPYVKVLIISGGDIEGTANKILGQGCDGVLQKPFNFSELSGKVKEILDR
ncbi:MAG: PAS domain S-box protein, partial [Deltaproteobacteria bacterium]|nr:PAS domain S-box protein [Deltaproteobacteria bacterium]